MPSYQDDDENEVNHGVLIHRYVLGWAIDVLMSGYFGTWDWLV